MARLGVYLGAVGFLVFRLTDGSGQDARLEGRRAQFQFEQGNPKQALDLYQKACGLAEGELRLQLLNNVGAAQVTLFRLREAEQTLLKVRREAELSGNETLLDDVNSNLAALYADLDRLPTAEMYAREAVKACGRTKQPWQRQRAILTLADIGSRQRLSWESEGYFVLGASMASAVHDRASEASAWLYYGEALLHEGRLEDASRAFDESRRVAGGSHQWDQAWWWNVSRLRLRQQDAAGAMEAIRAAFSAPEPQRSVPEWRLYAAEAEAELEAGDPRAALRHSRMALEAARRLRADLVPENNTLIGAEGQLDEVYTALIEAGNRVYLKTRDPKLVEETFEAAEENRADSLEKLLPTASDWRSHLPAPQYWDKLSELVAAQKRAVVKGPRESRDRIVLLQTSLSEMEAAAKATIVPRGDTILRLVERRLPAGASLLSVRLGKRNSWLWSVHERRLQLYRLPAADQVTGEMAAFEQAIQTEDRAEIVRAGRRLYVDLFGSLNASVAFSRQWFVSADEPLYSVAIPALVVADARRAVYLAQRHALLIIPGAQMLQPPMRGKLDRRRFLAAGDGVYNQADPRYGREALLRPASWSMPRLPASGKEVRFAANLWENPVLLTGPTLTRTALLRQIDRDPDAIHIASHVVAGPDRWRAGVLALGMDHAGDPELLTAQEILLHPIHSHLVAMTGCSSAMGDTLPASGLMGLTRAWLAAGAGEVMATRWPVKDEDQAGLIGSFYRHLLESPEGDIPGAMQQAWEDMLARGGWRAEPRYWASFFLIGVR